MDFRAHVRALKRIVRLVRGFAAKAPGTATLLIAILATTFFQWLIGAEAAQYVVQHVSTNLSNLLAFRLPVLVASAFWLEGDWLALQLGVWLVLFITVLAPAERWLGTRRWVIAFAVSHIGATVITAFRLWRAVKLGHQPPAVRDALDVGLSYGFLGICALSIYRLPGRWRWPVRVLLLAPLLVVLRIDRQFTDAGHVAAVLIGFGLFPLARAAEAESRTQPARPGGTWD